MPLYRHKVRVAIALDALHDAVIRDCGHGKIAPHVPDALMMVRVDSDGGGAEKFSEARGPSQFYRMHGFSATMGPNPGQIR